MPMNKEQLCAKRIPLSLRMQEILKILQEEVETHGKIECVADIGCDHAFVSMACVQNQLAGHVIAMDVRKGPLEIAQKNIIEYGFEKSVETRLSNGFQKLKSGEAGWAVIAGMGGILMNQILEAGETHLTSGIGLILQPQSEISQVRTCLETHGYYIEDERMLVEDSKFYTIIKAIKKETQVHMDEGEQLYGPVLIRKKDNVLASYLQMEGEKKKLLLARLEGNESKSAAIRKAQLAHELKVLRIVQSRVKEK